VAIAADWAKLTDLEDEEGEAAWSAGLQLAIPYTPHTLSLQASNTSTTTLEGASVGIGETRWGFEFTVPLTLSRYFGGRTGSAAAAPRAAGVRDTVAAEVGMTNQLRFTPDTVRIRVGETVRWTNSSDVVHTVTADPTKAVDRARVILPEGASTFDSGDLAPGATFEQTFTVAGEYRYICVPHELAGMLGVVIVEE
jgi:plastocyanin